MQQYNRNEPGALAFTYNLAKLRASAYNTRAADCTA